MRKACLQSIYELAKKDNRIVFIGSDLGAGTLDEFKNEMPDRFFMEGIAEQQIIGFAAGLAMEGYIPFVNTIATFLTRRCLEQIEIDVCMHNLPIRLVANGGGAVYAPLGPTHVAHDDIAFMRTLPNMTVLSPSDAKEMKAVVSATQDLSGPAYIRLGKGGEPIIHDAEDIFSISKIYRKRKGLNVALVSTGGMTHKTLQAAEQLEQEGHNVSVYHVPTVKPINIDELEEIFTSYHGLVIIEEHTEIGGLGSAICDTLLTKPRYKMPALLKLALPDDFLSGYGSQDSQLEQAKLNVANLHTRILTFIQAIN